MSDFIPMSFPAESRERDKESRIEMLVSLRNHSPAGFLGLLATNAAHRAIVSYQRHDDLFPSDCSHTDLIYDPVYRSVLEDAYRALQRKQDKGELDAEFLEACFGLICAQTIAGDFSKSRILQRYVQQVLQTITIPKDSQAWLPLVDMSTAMGMLSKPTIALPWNRAPVLDETLVRIRPKSDSRLSRLGVAFAKATYTTPQLRQLLENAVILCQFAEFHNLQSKGLGYYDHIMFRCKYHELHQDLLSYVYDVFPCTEDEPSALLVPVPALEQVIRLALLGMISNTMVVAHPATGLGRALTHHQKNALEFYGPRFTPAMDRAELKILLWALFVYAACALEQVEGNGFESKIAQACAWLGLVDWELVENVLTECLYIPSMQSKVWRALWQSAEREAATSRTTQRMTTQQGMLENRE